MAIVYSSIALVSLIIAVCWLITKYMGERHLGFQDSILRIGLLLLLVAPLFCWLYNGPNKLSIPILSAIELEDKQPESPAQNLASISSPGSSDRVAESHQIPFELQSPVKADKAPIAKVAGSAVDVPNRSRSLSGSLGYLSLIVWWAGSILAYVQILRAHFRAHAIKKNSCVLDDTRWHDAFARASAIVGTSVHRVQLRSSAQITSPILIGIRNPTILVPTQLLTSELSPATCEHILTHEFVHVQRSDMTSNLLLQIAVALWWWHPLVHWLKAKTKLTRELICDATTSHYQNAEDYAETLLRLANPRYQQLAFGLGVAGGYRDLEQRVSWILTRPELKQLRCINRSTSHALLFVICIVCLLASTVQFTPAVAQEIKKTENGPTVASEPPITAKQVATEEVPEPTEESLPKLPPLISGPQVRGQVVMPDGRPATTATVYMLDISSNSFELPMKPATAATNANGHFIFSNVAPSRYMFWAETVDLVSHFNPMRGRKLNVETQPTKVDAIQLKLHQASTFRFKVIDAETRAPISDTSIRPFPTGLVRARVSDQNGEAVFNSLTSDNWTFDVYKQGYAHNYPSSAKQPLGSTTEITVELAKGGTLKGKLVDQEGQPVGNCGLKLYPTLGTYLIDLPRTTSNPDGTFQLDDLPCETSYRIAADIETHDVAMVEFSISKKERTAFLEIVTPKRKQGISARFHVSDTEGNPIQGATMLNIGSPSNRKRKGVTDVQGDGQLLDMFLNGVDNADNIHVIVSAPGYADSKVMVTQDSTIERSPIVIKLGKETGFTARIVTPEGKPIEGVYIVASHPGSPYENTKDIRTNKEGIFVIPGTSNQIMLSIMPPKPYLSVDRQIFKIRPKDPSPKEIKLEYGGGIRIQAVDAQSGEELPRYKVKIGFAERNKDDPRNPGGISSELANGIDIVGGLPKFEMDNQRIGSPHLVMVSADGYADSKLPRVLSVKSDEAPLTIVKMTKANPLDFTIVTGTLRDEAGPIKHAKVRLASSGKPDVVTPWYSLKTDYFKDQTQCTQFHQTTSDDQGRFQFDKVLRSEEVIEIYYTHPAGDQRFRDLKVDTLAAGTHFDLVAQPRASLTLRVDLEHYPEAREVSISANPQMPGEPYQPIPFDDKNFPIEQFTSNDGNSIKLPPGTYQISLVTKLERNEDIPDGLTRKSLFSRKIVLTADDSLRLDL